jgi:hypothetical protein
MPCEGYMTNFQWSPTGKPVAPSSTPVRRNPEQGPPAKAGARVEGSKQDSRQAETMRVE